MLLVSRFRTRRVNSVSLVDFRGKVVILHFVYTNCPDVCPLHTERIADIQKMISGTAMRDLVQFVTITTDPAKDTQEVMRGYGKTHGLKDENWIFLTSGSDRLNSTRELVTEFGHKFTKINNGIQTHGVVTHIISRDGRWRANFHGLKFNSTNLIIFINALTNDIHSENQSRAAFFIYVNRIIYIMENFFINPGVTWRRMQDDPTPAARAARPPHLER